MKKIKLSSVAYLRVRSYFFADLNFASGGWNRKLSTVDSVCVSSYLSLSNEQQKSQKSECEVIENLLNIMCLSKSSVQIVNELTLMHAFLFAFVPFFGH